MRKSLSVLQTIPTIVVSFFILFLLITGAYHTYYIGFNLDERSFDTPELNRRVVFQQPQERRVTLSHRYIAETKKPVEKKVDSVSTTSSGVEAPAVDQRYQESLIQEDIDMSLAEAFNPKVDNKVLKGGEVSGQIKVGGGEIEELVVDFPNGDRLDVSYAQINGNLFLFEDKDGVKSSGVIYQVDDSYMITFSSGSYNGTRLKFSGGEQREKNPGMNTDDYYENRYPANDNETTDDQEQGYEF